MYSDYYNRFNNSYMPQQQPYMNYNQPNQFMTNLKTNKIYVSGVDEVRSKQQSPDTDFVYLDNDKPILYQKKVDSNGQFEVKTFSITPYKVEESEKTTSSIDLSSYAKTSEIEAIKKEIQALKNRIGGTNGTATGNVTNSQAKI